MPASDSLGIREGLTTLPSSFDPKKTVERLETEIRSKGLIIFANIDHAAGAEQVGLRLKPTNLIIFGNARGGTPLMQASQTAGIDLPLKMLVWQDAEGKTWLSYNEPAWIARRHGVGGRAEVVDNLTAALTAIVRVLAESHG